MEVLAGARSPRHESELRELFDRFELLRFDSAIDFNGAAPEFTGAAAAAASPREA